MMNVEQQDQATSSTHEAGHTPSARIAVACLICRSRRVRCNGERPTCSTCVATGKVCTWPTGRKRKRTKRETMEQAALLAASPARASDRKRVELDMSQSSFAIGDTSANSSFIIPSVRFAPAADNIPSSSTTQLVTTASENTITPEFDYSLTPDPDGYVTPDPDGSIDMEPSDRLILDAQLGADAGVELYYYRSGGATAIQPGKQRINLRYQSHEDSPIPPLAPSSGGIADASVIPPAISPHMVGLFDTEGLPYAHVWEPLFDIFLRHFVQYFPSISKTAMINRLESGTMSNFLSLSICALTARHAETATASPTRFCAPFISRAQEVAAPLLHLPTRGTCTALLLLSWAFYGQGSESGLWQYSGMAIRMAVDIGLHRASEREVSPIRLVRRRALWWSLYITDRMVAFSTGRPTTVPDELIELPLPETADFTPSSSRFLPLASHPTGEPAPFVYLTKLMVICGRISNILNVGKGISFESLGLPPSDRKSTLQQLQASVGKFFRDLPEHLRWNVDHFRLQHERGQGSAFLTLHLWGHAILIFLNQHSMSRSHILDDISTTPNSLSGTHALDIAAAKQMCDYIYVANTLSPKTYTILPFAVQPLFIAGDTLASEIKRVEGNVSTADPNNVVISMAQQGVRNVLTALARIEDIYAGAGATTKLLEKRSGISTERTTGVSPSISLPDPGLLRRFFSDRMPFAEESQASATWLTDLLAEYNKYNPTLNGEFDWEALVNSGSVNGLDGTV